MMADDYQIGGDHYTQLRVQPWEAMQAWMSDEEFIGFLRGNAIKYLARAGKKAPNEVGSRLEDVQKAQHYLTKLVDVLSGTQSETFLKKMHVMMMETLEELYRAKNAGR
jgi:hypothetical protein